MSLLLDAFGTKSAMTSSDWRNPQLWLVNAWGGAKTTSGERVSPDAAKKQGAYFACARNIAEDVAGLPLVTYERLKPRGKRVADEQLVAWLLHDEPNPEMGAMTFREALTWDAATEGHGLAEIERSGRGGPAALWPVHASRWVDMKRDGQGRLYHVILADDTLAPERLGTNYVTILDRDLLRVRGVGTGWRPMSVARLAAESVGIALAQEKANAALFGNGLMFGGFVESAQNMDQKQRDELRASLKERHGGAEKMHEIGMLPFGTKFIPNNIKPEEAQFVESSQNSVSVICRWFRMPEEMVQHTVNPASGTEEERAARYATWTLRPWCVRWEQEIARKLFPERTRYFAEHLLQGLMRGSYSARTSSYRTLITTGVMTVNEARELENLNPSDTENADELLIQGAMVPLRTAGKTPERGLAEPGTGEEQPGGNPPEPPAPEPKPAEGGAAALRLAFVRDACERVRRKESMAVERAARKCGKDRAAFATWCGTFYAEHESYVFGALKPVFDACGAGLPALATYAGRHAADRRAAVMSDAGSVADAGRMASDFIEILGGK